MGDNGLSARPLALRPVPVTKATPGTVNRERAVLSHLFNKARAWGPVKRNPVTQTEQ